MDLLTELINLLVKVRNFEPEWERSLSDFLHRYGAVRPGDLSPNIFKALENLWSILHEYEPEPEFRYEPFYGEDRLKQVLDEAFDELRNLGINIPE
jgi:hypothetical protein